MYIGWGYNVTGKLGTNTTDRKLKIGHYVELYSKLTQISLVHGHAVFVSDLGKLYVCGSNKYGQLGLGHVKDVIGKPQLNNHIQGKVATAVCGYGITLLLLVDHSIYLCGMDCYRRVGGSKTIEPKRVRQVGRHNRVIDIAIVHNIASPFPNMFVVVTKKGKVFYLPLTTRSMHAAKRVWGVERIVQISAGNQHVVALSKEGKVYHWMFQDNGQITLPPNAASMMLPFNNNKIIVEIDVGYYHCLALTSTGHVYSWGENTFGQLGIPHLTPFTWHSTPNRVLFYHCYENNLNNNNNSNSNNNNNIVFEQNQQQQQQRKRQEENDDNESKEPKIVNIAAGAYHSVAVDDKGNVYTWGRNNAAQLGDTTHRHGDMQMEPMKIKYLEKISHVFSGGDSVIAARSQFFSQFQSDVEQLWNWN